MYVRYRWLLVLLYVYSARVYGWSWLHSVVPSQHTKAIQKNRSAWLWEKTGIKPFSQLIFSWNAIRPTEGHFTFFVQVRDKLTRAWYPWHRMAEWGKNIQRSFSSKSRRGTQFHYVRLELPEYRLADGIRIRVKFAQRAHLANIAQITVNTVNLRQFISELYDPEIKKLSSVLIKHVPLKSQMVINHPRFNTLCSPTSTSMLLGYLLNKDVSPQDCARGVYDTGLNVYGSWPFNTAHAFEQAKGKFTFHVERLKSFKQLHEYLVKNIPVIVSIKGPVKGGALSYKQGHLVLVIGYDKLRRKVWCHDPAFASNHETRVMYDLPEFLTAWERSRRLAYVARPTT